MILALDVGEKRVGLAISDPEEKLAIPLGACLRAGGRAEKEIISLIRTKGINTLVIGLPLSADDSRNKACLMVENFAKRLAKRVSIKVTFVDEWGSSEEAKEKLELSSPKRGLARSKKLREKGVLDALSAAIILESFLLTN